METSGFNLYRFGRLIRAHEKLGYLYHPSKMWIAGEIHLDPIPVTHNKREFIKENPLYIDFFEQFKEILKPVLAEAQQRHKEEKIKDLPKELRETLKDNLLKALDKVDDFKELAFPNLAKRTDDPAGVLSEKEKRSLENQKVTEIKYEEPEKKQTRTPNKTNEKKARFITIAGKKYQFDWEWKPLDENVAKEGYLDKDRAMIMVILNSRYHMLNVVKPDWFYHAIYVTEGIVEVFLKENGQPLDKVLSLRDKTVKQLADVFSEDIEEQNATKENQVMEAHSFLLKNKSGENLQEDKKLTENEKKVLQMRLEEGLSMVDISNSLKVTRARAYQLFDAALKKVTIIDEPEQKFEIDLLPNLNLGNNKGDVYSIIHSTAERYGVSTEALLSPSRLKELVLPRHMIMYMIRKNLGFSFPKIAQIMNREDHTTIIHAYNKIDKLIGSENKETANSNN